MLYPIKTTLFAMLVLLAISAVNAVAEQPKHSRLAITITGIQSHTGTMMIAVFASENAYANGQRDHEIAIAANADQVITALEGLVPGTYAIKLFHDVNSDEKLNTNRLGIPSEPYGFSNDAPVRFGPPKWEAAKFTVIAGDNQHRIGLSQ